MAIWCFSGTMVGQNVEVFKMKLKYYEPFVLSELIPICLVVYVVHFRLFSLFAFNVMLELRFVLVSACLCL